MAERPVQRIVRIAELEIDPGQIESFRTLLAEEIEASVQNEPGVLFLHAVAMDAPQMVRVIECYADQFAYQAHLTTPHFLKYKSRTANMVWSLRLIETEPIALRAKSNHNSN
ncbi:MAG: antibiotic biosynthesis monooxygenase [Mesorhizobium sp.]|uniref:putative quinol monooxygenase n=1 Tax=Mesorhizobium sp. TaxID=1871066 RepID=UPI000FE5A8DB|nr:antibiotic biosynthesis monooxygenase [Mesorhizobium sp.]RWD60081.1 MAG: antibiotic biosynthesis monooxygenase [Mesorhizobium sp.]RWE32291.1 MAG: antibiotic biosynthesis monooxygenase [Mesorhizobium sp.]